MPGCCVPGCSNSTAKGFSMRSFPTDPKRKALWIANINKSNWEPKTNSRICEVCKPILYFIVAYKMYLINYYFYAGTFF